jgi:hypothetical protein
MLYHGVSDLRGSTYTENLKSTKFFARESVVLHTCRTRLMKYRHSSGLGGWGLYSL